MPLFHSSGAYLLIRDKCVILARNCKFCKFISLYPLYFQYIPCNGAFLDHKTLFLSVFGPKALKKARNLRQNSVYYIVRAYNFRLSQNIIWQTRLHRFCHPDVHTNYERIYKSNRNIIFLDLWHGRTSIECLVEWYLTSRKHFSWLRFLVWRNAHMELSLRCDSLFSSDNTKGLLRLSTGTSLLVNWGLIGDFPYFRQIWTPLVSSPSTHWPVGQHAFYPIFLQKKIWVNRISPSRRRQEIRALRIQIRTMWSLPSTTARPATCCDLV